MAVMKYPVAFLSTLSDNNFICNQSFVRDYLKLMRLPRVAISSFVFGLNMKKVYSVLDKEVSSANIIAWKYVDASDMSLIYVRKYGTPVVSFWE